MTTPSTFTRKEAVDKPGIIGARWWQESVATQVPRRQAMTGLVALGGVLAAMAAIGTCVAVSRPSTPAPPPGPAPDEVKFEPRGALDLQREYGWNFGATDESLVFDGQSTKVFERAALARMADELAPSDARYQPFFVPTLFQAPSALRKTTLASDPGAVAYAPLSEALVPIFTPAMERAFGVGQAVASLMDARAKDVAVVVDLPGPEAVAFAAGAASSLDPVFLFDNWPHPKGVVPAHLTLAAAAFYQPLFALMKSKRPKGARPAFVLDRKRLTPYADEATQFDNRHTSRLPSATALAGIGVKTVLYVSPNAIDRQELEDLVDDFLAFGTAKIGLRVVPATAFDPVPGGSPDGGASPFFYGGSAKTHPTFWTHWSAPATSLATNDVQTYVPTPRVTPYSTGTPASGSTRTRPTNFGMVPVAIAVGTGVLLGARLSRSGSWNRTTSTSTSS